MLPGEDAILNAPFVSQVSHTPLVKITNVSTGMALNIAYIFQQLEVQPGNKLLSPDGIVEHLKAGEDRDTQIARASLDMHLFEFSATYEGLLRRRHQTRSELRMEQLCWSTSPVEN